MRPKVHKPAELAHLELSQSQIAAGYVWMWERVDIREVYDEYDVSRVFEFRKPNSKAWKKGSVSLAHRLNKVAGDASEASIWYDPKTLTEMQASELLKAYMLSEVQDQITSLTHSRDALEKLSLP
jgi:hypothetical protein